MISGMTSLDETKESQATALCRSCGLCCTGHLFVWAKLRPAELDDIEALGMQVFRSDPNQRGFSLPCPVWQGQCTIHSSPHYPRVCRAYKCKLLKELLNEDTSLSEALPVIAQAKGMIQELEAFLPSSATMGFRERLVARLESPGETGQDETDLEFRRTAETLLLFYEKVFGVDDLVDKPAEE